MESNKTLNRGSLRVCICAGIAGLPVSIVSFLGLFDTIDRWICQELVTLFEVESISFLNNGFAPDIAAQLTNTSPLTQSLLIIVLITAAAFAGVRIATALRPVPGLGVIVVLALCYEVIAFLAGLVTHRVLDLSATPAALLLGHAITLSDGTLWARWRRLFIEKRISRHVPSEIGRAHV